MEEKRKTFHRRLEIPVQVERKMLSDPELSFEEKGILSWMDMMHEEESQITLEALCYWGDFDGEYANDLLRRFKVLKYIM